MIAEILIAVLSLAGVPEDPQASKPEPGKKSARTLKVASVDPKSHRIDVKEPGFDIVWQEGTTRFYRHHTVLLKDLAAGTPLLVFGKRHEERDDDSRPGGARTDTLVSDIEIIGTGDAFVKPELTAKAQGISWQEGKLSEKRPPSIEIKKKRYRLTGDDKLAAYSLDKLAPEKLTAGQRVVICGNARKVTVERDGKPVEVTRIQATEVHCVELSAEHTKVFQAEWVERKKETEAAGSGGKGVEKGK